MRTPGTFSSWAIFAAAIGGTAATFAAAAWAFDVGGLLVPAIPLSVAAFGAAMVARDYRRKGDGEVSGPRRLFLGCLGPLALVALWSLPFLVIPYALYFWPRIILALFLAATATALMVAWATSGSGHSSRSGLKSTS